MNAISTVTTHLVYAEMERLAEAIAKSNMFGMKTKEQALVLMAISQAEGRHPAMAARDYDVISGKPAKKAEAMLRDFFEAGGKVVWNALTDEGADATFSHPQGGSARISWDMERARNAGLASKENYKRFPRQMLRSRVVSEGVRTVWPMATSGMYVPEEAADMPPTPAFTGTTIDAAPEAAPAPKPTPAAKPAAPRKPRRTVGEWLDDLEVSLLAAENLDQVEATIGGAEVQHMLATLKNGALARLNALVSAALERVNGPAPEYPQDDHAQAESEMSLP